MQSDLVVQLANVVFDGRTTLCVCVNTLVTCAKQLKSFDFFFILKLKKLKFLLFISNRIKFNFLFFDRGMPSVVDLSFKFGDCEDFNHYQDRHRVLEGQDLFHAFPNLIFLTLNWAQLATLFLFNSVQKLSKLRDLRSWGDSWGSLESKVQEMCYVKGIETRF